MNAVFPAIKSFFAPPVFEDQDKTRMARNSFVLAILGLIIPVVLLILFLILSPGTIVTIGVIALSIFVSLLEIFLLRGGLVQLTISLQAGVIWVSVVAASFSTGGIHSLGFIGGTFAALLVLGIAHNWLRTMVFTAASVLAAVVLIWGERQGFIDPSRATQNPILLVAIYTSFLLILTGLLYVNYRSVTQALTQAHREIQERERAEVRVRQLNVQLEQRVAQRTRELAASEERYRLISRVSSDYTFSTGVLPDGRLQLDWVAGAFEGITGYTYEDYVARGGWVAALHPDDGVQDARDLARLRTNQPVVSEVRTIARDGAVHWVRVYAHPVWDAERNELIGIYGAVQDISERKRAEQVQSAIYRISEAAQTAQSLKELHGSIYAIISELMPTRRNFYIALYDAAAGLFHFPFVVDEIDEEWPPMQPGKGLTNYVYRTGKPQLVTPEVFKQLEQSGQAELMGKPAVDWLGVPLKTHQGTIGVMAAQTYTQADRLTEADQAVLTFLSTQVAMVIERKREEAERENLIEELETKNAELERFTYTVSHDLKSPLITIRGFLGFLEKDAVSGNLERLSADIKRISAAADKMQQLLNELLELSRIGRIVNPPQAVSLQQIAREAVALVEGRLSARGVSVEIAPNLPPVYGDRARLVEVVQNLVDNACKFMGDQAAPRITIGVEQREGEPVFFVADNGIGIDPQYHEKVFGLFNKLDAGAEGTGVGLALVKRIIEVHGGRIWVESEQGQGATFCFTLAAPHGLDVTDTGERS